MTTALSTWHDFILPDVYGCPKFVMNRAIVKAIIDFCQQTEILTYGINHTVYNSEPDSYKNNIITYSTISTDKKPWKIKKLFIDGGEYRISFKRLYNDISELASILSTSGQKFYYFPDRRLINIFPFEDSDFSDSSIELYMDVVFIPLSAITEIDDEIYYDWREAITNGAKAILMLQNDMNWYEPKKAAYHQSKFNKDINNYLRRRNLIENNGELRVEIPSI